MIELTKTGNEPDKRPTPTAGRESQKRIAVHRGQGNRSSCWRPTVATPFRSARELLLRLDKPGPGVAALGTFNMGGPSMVALNFYLHGDQAAGTVARETPHWEAWFQKRFPMPTEPTKSD